MQARAVVNVGQKDGGLSGVPVDPVRDHRGRLTPAQQQGFQEGVPPFFADQDKVIEDVGKIDPPLRRPVRPDGHQEVFPGSPVGPLLGEGERVQELWPAVADQPVEDGWFDGFAAPWDALHHAIRLVPSFGRIEQNELPHARIVVMTSHDGDEPGGVAGDRTGVEHGVGPIGVAAVKRHLLGPVRVHVEEDSRDVVGYVGVLPAQVKHPATIEDCRAPVVILVERKPTDRAGAAFEVEQIGDV